MATQKVRHIKLPRGTTAKASQYKGKPGEIVIDMEAKELRIHDGIAVGGHAINSGSGALIAWDEAVTGNLGAQGEGATVSISVKALSAFDEAITYTVVQGQLPPGLSINEQGVITGTLPAMAQSQTFSFRIRAADRFNAVERDFTISVVASNDVPVWQTPSDLGRVVGPVSIQLVANDPDGTLTYSLVSGTLPDGLSLAASGLLSGTVTVLGQTHNFTVQASDGENSVSRTFTIKTGIATGDAIDGDIVVGQLPGGDYLLVAPAIKRAQKRWGLYGTDTTLPNIGSAAQADPNTGKHNTDVLVSATYANVNDGQGSVGAPAAKWCRDQGYDLPNKEELNLIYQNRAAIDAADTSGGAEKLSITGANAPRVWSSSENGGSAAWVHYFADGATGATSKSNEYLAVPVRRFNTI